MNHVIFSLVHLYWSIFRLYIFVFAQSVGDELSQRICLDELTRPVLFIIFACRSIFQKVGTFKIHYHVNILNTSISKSYRLKSDIYLQARKAWARNNVVNTRYLTMKNT